MCFVIIIRVERNAALRDKVNEIVIRICRTAAAQHVRVIEIIAKAYVVPRSPRS